MGIPDHMTCHYAKAFGCVDHNKLWKILKEMGIPEHLTHLLRKVCAGQEATEPDMKQWTGSKSGNEVPVRAPPAGDQPQLIQGIGRRDGLGDYLYALQRYEE